MELTNITFYREGDGNNRHIAEVSLDMETLVQANPAFSSRSVVTSTFWLPMTPELMAWADSTMSALRDELHKYLGDPLR